ncbi:hypothetical protein QR680_011910 [Steinernema hermaphroditum]|uniref:G-protein coupled receptors family 1 profile domain-containing protein n=1 Tax=Steinernema hermaphroditum TaxID=289476 RepID=A0AA39I061_9BILA|nr:hypothetical protein QR680_011910 [Steinernema hermaphroditum]
MDFTPAPIVGGIQSNGSSPVTGKAPPMIFLLLPIFGLSPFGLFGNINIIIATFRKKNFRGKCGILICLLAIYDTICLISEVRGGIMVFYGVSMDRQTCFKMNIVYFWTQLISSSTLIGLAFDRLISVTLPLRYRSNNLAMMLTVSTLPGLLLSAVFTILGVIHWDEENAISPSCSPKGLLLSYIQNIANWTLLVMNASVIGIYLTGYIVLFMQRRRNIKQSHLQAVLTSHQRAMRSLTVFLTVFSASWFYSQFALSVLLKSNPNDMNGSFLPQTVQSLIMGSVPAALIVSYSQCYYVYFWTSSEYRTAFLEQLGCGKKMWKPKTFKTSVVSVTLQNMSK